MAATRDAMITDVGEQPASGQGCGCAGSGSGPDGAPHFLPRMPRLRSSAQPPAWSRGMVDTPSGPVLRIATAWSGDDRWGMVRSRISAFRMKYAVPPGLYAAGSPTGESDVFVTANYKLSFDSVRRELAGMDAWLLVLDTKGINVWCAAGKGTFGTEELVDRLALVRLAEVVSHRRLILPQLGAVGVNAAAVAKRTGFRVSFGPVQARDIPAYVRNGRKKTPEMSTIDFPLLDRLVLTPMEIDPAMRKYYPWFAAAVLLLFGLQPTGILFGAAWSGGALYLALGLVAVASGAFLTPAALPFIPFRSFAVKGWIAGMAAMLCAELLFDATAGRHMLVRTAAFLFFPALSSYIALQFTGSTTFTGMSGVKKELRIGLPVYAGVAAISVMLLAAFKLAEWGVL